MPLNSSCQVKRAGRGVRSCQSHDCRKDTCDHFPPVFMAAGAPCVNSCLNQSQPVRKNPILMIKVNKRVMENLPQPGIKPPNS